MILANADLSLVGQNTLLLVVGLITAYNAWRQKKTDATINQIHILTNSAMLITLKSLAEVTAAKAAITHEQPDIEAASKALKDYLGHVERGSKNEPEEPLKTDFKS